MSAAAMTTKGNASVTRAKHATGVYHVGPWRLFWGWAPFLPLAVGCAIGAMFADTPDERAGLWVGALAFTLVMAGLVWMIRRARLEVCADGITLRQIGFRIETTWSNVVAIRTDRGREGFITSAPVGGKGLKTLAAATSLNPNGMYDYQQQDLIDQHRFVPIEAFAWHLRKGMLRRDVRAFAPHLGGHLATLDHEPAKTPSDPQSWWLLIGIFAAILAYAVPMSFVDERVQALVADIIYALIAPAFVFFAATATWQMIKRGSWLFTVLMAMMTLVVVGWTILQWARLFA